MRNSIITKDKAAIPGSRSMWNIVCGGEKDEWRQTESKTQRIGEVSDCHCGGSRLRGHFEAFFKSQTKSFAFPFTSLSGVQEGEGTLER